jgi:Family of unknown function (DUF5988)
MRNTEPNVILRGAPSTLPPSKHICYVEDISDRFKLPTGNHYEHFEPTPEVEKRFGRDLRVFVWTGCTYIAE